MKLTRPTQLVAQLAFIQTYAPDEYLPRHETTNAQAFAEALDAIQYFKQQTPTDEGREALEQCARNLRVAFEMFEKDDPVRACHFVQDTSEMFQKARKYIALDE
jgi:hypothetical protein